MNLSFNWLFCYLLTMEADQPINWREEAESAESFGFGCYSFDLEQLMAGDIGEALAELPPGHGQVLGYRGWILSTDQYEQLADGVNRLGYRLLTNPYQYDRSSRLPEWHPLVADLTPPAIWTETKLQYPSGCRLPLYRPAL
ncbi:MAG: hypothetical protein AAF492_29280 [Verrucomicrobiota bacterium]